MRNLKKLVALLIAFAMILSTATVSFAATMDFSDVTDADQQEAIALLTTLDVVNGYPDGTYKPANVVTRAEMAKLIVSALDYSTLASATTSDFTDMASAQWAQGFVALASGIGVVKGYPNGTFMPNSTVTYAEAATMIVRALGYTDEYLGGTWPNNYLAKALDLDIFDNVEVVGTGATRGNIAIMLFNAIDQEIGKVDNDNKFNEEDTSMIEKLGAVEFDEMVIEGTEDTLINLRPWVGVYASGYMNDDDEIILLNNEATELVGQFNDDMDKFENSIDYTVRAAVLDNDVDFFYNGDLHNDGDLDWILDNEVNADVDVMVSVDADGTTIKEAYAVSQWMVTNDGLFTDSDMDDIDDDSTLLGYDFILDDDEDIDMDEFELVGVDSFSDIEEDDVVYVFANEADQIRKVAIGTETVSGEITRVNSGEDEYTVGGKVYEVSYFADDTVDDFGAGDDVTLRLDADGQIYSIEESEDEEAEADKFAVVLEIADGDPAINQNLDAVAKLFLADESDDVFVVEDDDYVDEDTLEWIDVIGAGTLIEFGTDDDDIIDAIDIDSVYDEAEVTDRGYFMGKYIASDAVIFVLDGNADDEDDYTIVDRSDIEEEYIEAQYIVDNNKIVAMLIENGDELGTTVTDEEDFGVFYDWAAISNGTDYEINMIVNGDVVVLGTDEDFSGYDELQLYEITYNTSDEVTSLAAVAYDAEVATPDFDDDAIGGWTIDFDAIIYIYDGDDYEVGSTSDVDEYAYAYLYDVLHDNDDVIDIVILSDDQMVD